MLGHGLAGPLAAWADTARVGPQFAATACTIVSGAIAERARFESYILYSFFMAAWVYPILTHSGAGLPVPAPPSSSPPARLAQQHSEQRPPRLLAVLLGKPGWPGLVWCAEHLYPAVGPCCLSTLGCLTAAAP